MTGRAEAGAYNLLVFSRCMPYDGIDHAGGEYLLRSVRTASTRAKVTVVAIDAPRNRQALKTVPTDYTPILLKYRGIYGSRVFDILRKVQNRLLPLTLPFGVSNAMKRDEFLRSACDQADVVEYQWTELACLRHRLPPAAGAARSVVVAHDVLTQRYSRQHDSARWFLRPFSRVRRDFVTLRERRLLGVADEIVTFSEKDAALLEHLAPAVPVRVVFPPLYDDVMELPKKRVEGRAVFIATFARRENADAADWLLREIWPVVLREVPEAELVLAGSGSDNYLAGVADELRRGVVATGYLESLDQIYQTASVALVPMRLGAGVKFKTLTAMLWNLPIVATEVGVEGIELVDAFAGVTDDPDEFARLTASVLNHPEVYEAKGERARAWARDLAGPEQFAESIFMSHGMGSA